jgi:hydroxyacylglutathione hydrolase
MEILRLPALSNNYIFLLYCAQTQTAVVIDPGEAQPVLKSLRQHRLRLSAIWITHPDRDHIGGVAELLQSFPAAVVYGSAVDRGRIPNQQVFLKAEDWVEFAGRPAQVLFLPGHTLGHIAYYFPPAPLCQPRAGLAVSGELGELFCGDVLFGGGCGRLKEGTPAQMVNSLTQLRQLPNTTRVWCAHEYTHKNLQFALTVDPGNPALQQRHAQTQAQQVTIPSVLGLEKQTNPFLRWDDPAVQSAMNSRDPIETFTRLRRRKDQF